MKVFVAHGFRPRDRWVGDHVVPLVEAFGAQVLTGEHLGGEQITDAVKERIRDSDGMIGFLTAREAASTADETHRWVSNELAFALANPGTRILEVREVGVTDQGGLPGDRQHLVYDPSDEASCLVGIARVLGEWSQGITMRVLLLPDDIVQKITPLMTRPGFTCTYSLSVEGRVTTEMRADLIRRPGGVQLTARGIPPAALLSVRVQAAGVSYRSAFVDIDALTILLEEEV